MKWIYVGLMSLAISLGAITQPAVQDFNKLAAVTSGLGPFGYGGGSATNTMGQTFAGLSTRPFHLPFQTADPLRSCDRDG